MGRYVIWQPDMGQNQSDGVKVTARDAGKAVEEWADYDDLRSLEFHIVGGQPATVLVHCINTGAVSKWIVSGESVRHYSARPAPDATPTR